MALMFSPGGEGGRKGGENRASGGRFGEARGHPGGRSSGGSSMIDPKKGEGGGLRECLAGLGMPSRQRTKDSGRALVTSWHGLQVLCFCIVGVFALVTISLWMLAVAPFYWAWYRLRGKPMPTPDHVIHDDVGSPGNYRLPQ